MKPKLNPELRGELTLAATHLKTAIAKARAEGAAHLEAVARHQAWMAGDGARLVSGPAAGQSDVAGQLVKAENAVAASEAHVRGAKRRLLAAVEATQVLQARVFTAIHGEVRAEIRRALAPFYTASGLENVQRSDLENRIGMLRLRLHMIPQAGTFASILGWAEMTQQVLADLGAGLDVFTLEPEEPKAA